MRLTRNDNSDYVVLPNGLWWKDELNWSTAISSEERSLTGALIIQGAHRIKGRPITLEPAQPDMGWASRADAMVLQEWAAIFGLKFTLALEYPTDSRSFVVSFRQNGVPFEAEHVKGFPGHANTDWYRVTLRLLEVTA